jgi:hypothetical protein
MKLGRRRLGYKKTVYKAKPYKKSYYQKKYGRYGKYVKSIYSKYRRPYGRQRISKVFKSTQRIQKVSKLITTVTPVRLVGQTYCIYNGLYLPTEQLQGELLPVYVNLITQLPEKVYADEYSYLSLEPYFSKPILRLKETTFSIAKDSLSKVSFAVFYHPILAHYETSKDLQMFLAMGEFPDSYTDNLTCIVNESPNYQVKLVGELGVDDKRAVKEFIEQNRKELYSHFVSTVVGIDVKNIHKFAIHIVVGVNRAVSVTFLKLDNFKLVANINDVKRAFLFESLMAIGYSYNDIEPLIVPNLNRFTDRWVRLFNSVYNPPFVGFHSACVGLDFYQKKALSQFLTSVFVVGDGGDRGIDDAQSRFSYYCGLHYRNELPEADIQFLNAVASKKLFSLKHVGRETYENTLNESVYTPSEKPNIILITSLNNVNIEITQRYKISPSSTMKTLRLAMYNNPMLYDMLSEKMKLYVDKLYPELKLYKEGRRQQDRYNRGRH